MLVLMDNAPPPPSTNVPSVHFRPSLYFAPLYPTACLTLWPALLHLLGFLMPAVLIGVTSSSHSQLQGFCNHGPSFQSLCKLNMFDDDSADGYFCL